MFENNVGTGLNEQRKFSTEPYYFLDVICKVHLITIRGEVVEKGLLIQFITKFKKNIAG